MELVLASNNPHKVTEVRRILDGIAVRTPAELGVPFSFEETGSTYDQNALGKARHLHHLTGMPTLADDSGLAVAALGGAPGVRSARFAPPGEVLDDAGRCSYLLSLLRGAADRSAAFICCIALGPGFTAAAARAGGSGPAPSHRTRAAPAGSATIRCSWSATAGAPWPS